MKAVMLSIAGSDCSAGAGLQADMKAGLAAGSYPLTVLSCAVSEIPGKVGSIIPMSPDFVAEQLRLCLESFPVGAIKTGMLYSPDIVRAVADVLDERAKAGVSRIPLVVDPVMIASAGEPLMQQQAIEVYEQRLLPHATLLTPNIDESCALLGRGSIANEEQLALAAQELAARYACAVLCKGGHLEGDDCVDILAHREAGALSLKRWEHPRVIGASTHGTGCSLSASIAARLSCGLGLLEAVEQGLLAIERAIATSYQWDAPLPLQALCHEQPSTPMAR